MTIKICKVIVLRRGAGKTVGLMIRGTAKDGVFE